MDKRPLVCKMIRVSGVVQGVGFRPFVFRLAEKHGVFGTARNLGGSVEIEAQAPPDALDAFLRELESAAPAGAKPVSLAVSDMPAREFGRFRILESGDCGGVKIVPADLPYCEKCGRDLARPGGRRYRNPFVSCMSCGPRYSVIERLPYDRENTAMADFPLCENCAREYLDPKNRRFYAQTVCCNGCGPTLYCKSGQKNLTGDDALNEAAAVIGRGGIAAVKGIGGFHFACSARSARAAANLRRLKGREEKPFAVLFETVADIRNYCAVSREEERLLRSDARPIVLLYTKESSKAKLPYEVCKDSVYCGAFLPYSPIQKLLAGQCGPLVMTSANLSGEPVITDDREILRIESPLLDCRLYHDRPILRAADDSVARAAGKAVQLIRRSRGYAPLPVTLAPAGREQAVLAAGGDLKAAFCLYRQGRAFVSQYFGDLEDEKTFRRYTRSIADLKSLLNIEPELVVCDLHPGYFSARHAEGLGALVLRVQHHHAHIASVMAEHRITQKVIGVAFDGTGRGTDGAVWGGEFLVCEGGRMKRAGHLSYTPVLGGDPLAADAKKTAACYLLHAGLFDELEYADKSLIKSAIDHGVNTVLCSSAGRLFDAVSAILGVADRNAYEGQCAAALEKEALKARRSGIKPYPLRFAVEDGEAVGINPVPLLRTLFAAKGKADKGALALGFHLAVAAAVLEVCGILRERENCGKIALSGGVFQNRLLTETLLKRLGENKFEVYLNRQVPPNDGGLCLGQAYIGLAEG